MKPSIPPDAPAPAPLSLACPYCSQPVLIDDVALIEGSDVRCPHCGQASVLEREYLGHGAHYRWLLVEGGDDVEP